MKSKKTYHGYTDKELRASLGHILIREGTKHTAVWQTILREAGLPAIPKDVVVLLTGKRRERFNGLGETQRNTGQKVTGRRFYVIALHDWIDEEFDSCYQELHHVLPRLFPKTERERVRRLYLIETYLHELGHARKWTSKDEGEQYAEEYAWREMSRIFDDEDVMRVFAFFWFYES